VDLGTSSGAAKLAVGIFPASRCGKPIEPLRVSALGSVLVALPVLPQRIRIAAVAWDLLRIAAASL
jgi:hypothetical protein